MKKVRSGPEESQSAEASDTAHGVTDNPWRRLRQFTDARIGLGRAGVSLPTKPMLDFQLAHAQARDAVHLALDLEALEQSLSTVSEQMAPPIPLTTQATDRICYLQRPDLGRLLSEDARSRLANATNNATERDTYDLALVVVDGLSSLAVQQNTAPFLDALLTALGNDSLDWQLAPLTVVQQGRVAIGDEVGEQLQARAVLVMIGERPGLSSPDSLGLYLTWGPKRGTRDSRRNCISNVRPAGLSYQQAAERTLYFLKESRAKQISGVALKDRSEDQALENVGTGRPTSFLARNPVDDDQ